MQKFIMTAPLSKRLVGNKLYTGSLIGGGGGVATPKNRTLPQISNLGLVFFGFFGFFRFFCRFFLSSPILTGLTCSCYVVLVGYNSFYETFAGLYRH